MCFSPNKQLKQKLDNAAAMAPPVPCSVPGFVVLFLAFGLLIVGALAGDGTCRRGSWISEVRCFPPATWPVTALHSLLQGLVMRVSRGLSVLKGGSESEQFMGLLRILI